MRAGCFDPLPNLDRSRLRHDDCDWDAKRAARHGRSDPGISTRSAENLPGTPSHFVLTKPPDTPELETAGGLQGIEFQPKRKAAAAIAGSGAKQRGLDVERQRGHRQFPGLRDYPSGLDRTWRSITPAGIRKPANRTVCSLARLKRR